LRTQLDEPSDGGAYLPLGDTTMTIDGLGPTSDPIFREVTLQWAEELIEHLLPIESSWLHKKKVYWFFRGHSSRKWSLSPSAFRTSTDVKHGGEIVKVPPIVRWSSVTGQVADRMPSPTDIIHREMQVVREYCDSLAWNGLEIPFDSPVLRGEERPEYTVINFPPAEYRGMFALAQHYGVPTRFLDWTRKPLVAAYFACVGQAQRRTEEKLVEPEDAADAYISVWALNDALRPFFSRLDPGFDIVTAPGCSNPNLHAQGGVFTLPRFKKDTDRARTELPGPIDSIIKDMTLDDIPKERHHLLPALVKFNLPCTEARTLLRLLSDFQVTAAEIYPGHAGAAQAMIEKKWFVFTPKGEGRV